MLSKLENHYKVVWLYIVSCFQDYRIKGESAYDENDWTNVIEWTELAIAEYYNEEERCQLECEGHFDHLSFPDFIQAIAGWYNLQIFSQISERSSVFALTHWPEARDK